MFPPRPDCTEASERQCKHEHPYRAESLVFHESEPSIERNQIRKICRHQGGIGDKERHDRHLEGLQISVLKA